MSKNLFLILLLCFFGAGWLNAQEASDVDRKTPAKAGVDIMGGAMFFADKSEAATVIGANFWTTLSCNDNNRFRWCMLLELPWWWRQPIQDPWRDMGPIIIWPPFPIPPGPDPEPWDNFRLSQVQLGRTLIVSPSLGLRFGSDRLNFHLFGGGGFQHTQANTSEIRGFIYRTTDATAPLITYGAAARYHLTDGISVRVEFRSLKTFEGNMSVIGPDGSVALFEGMAMNTPMLSAGIGVGLR